MFVVLLPLFTYGQKVWDCADYHFDVSKFNKICDEFKSKGNKRWSKELLTAFPLSPDGTIKYQYVIATDSTFNVEDIRVCLLNWYKKKMTNVNPSPTGSPERLSAIGVIQNLGRHIGYMNATFIHAVEEVTIDIKENRVRVTVEILSYSQANTWDGAKKVSPGACYPANEGGKQKDSHAMAFINCHNEALNTVGSVINHLNNHYKTIMNGDDEW